MKLTIWIVVLSSCCNINNSRNSPETVNNVGFIRIIHQLVLLNAVFKGSLLFTEVRKRL